MFRFCQSLGRETLTTEYKLFALPPALLTPLSEQLVRLVSTGEWTFNHIVERTLKAYIAQFHDRYRDAYSTLESPGQLWIGVHDSGTVHGIPYQGELCLDKLRAHCPDPTTVFELFEVDTSGVVSNTKPHPRLVHYLCEQRKSDILIRDRKAAYIKWSREFRIYTRKLTELYHTPSTRAEFLEYLTEHDVRLDNLPHRIEQKKYHEIRDMMQKKQGIYYWLCKWKDERVRAVLARKPKKVSMKQRHRATRYGPDRILSNVAEMIPYWLPANENMKLYLLRLTFHNKSLVGAKNARVVVNDQPCCVPI